MATSSFNRSSLTYPQAIKNVCDFRLTLVSGTPVMTSSQTGITTLYMTPYKGNEISLYDGTNWQLYTTSEISLSLAGLTASKNYDIWCYNNAGTPTLEALVWTDDTTRATALTTQDGVYVKTGATTRRYIGTIRINSTGGQCNFIYGAASSGATAGDLGVWNYYNRVLISSLPQDNKNSWTYNSGTFRSADNSTTYRNSFVIGVAEDTVFATYSNLASPGAGAQPVVGIGLNVTNAFTGNTAFTNAASSSVDIKAEFRQIVAAGYNYIQALESSNGGTSTYQGDAGLAAVATGLFTSILM